MYHNGCILAKVYCLGLRAGYDGISFLRYKQCKMKLFLVKIKQQTTTLGNIEMKIYFLIAAITFLSACTMHADIPNRMVIDSDGVTIDSRDGHNKHKGSKNFCPPGQAKKGNC